jgi:hypothetical protein
MLTIGGAASAAGAVVIDMPPAPAVVRHGADPAEPAETAPPPKLGDLALRRYARARHEPSYTPLSSRAWWGWPHGRRWFGYGFGLAPTWGWGWGWGWCSWPAPHCGGWPYGWGYGLRHPRRSR